MLNFMIAILSTTYGEMLEIGSFSYKCKLYEYCERYMIAFSDENYGELVVHPPPLNSFCIVMMPFALLLPQPRVKDGKQAETQSKMLSISKTFSKIEFWVENILLLPVFIGIELAMIPLVYMKGVTNIVVGTEHNMHKVIHVL